MAPLLVAAILTVFAYLLADQTSQEGEEVLSATVDSAIAILYVVIGYTLTFGLISVLGLWALDQAGFLTWLLTGVIAGAIAGILFGTLALSGIERGALVIFAIMGGALMILIRAIAGIRDTDEVPMG